MTHLEASHVSWRCFRCRIMAGVGLSGAARLKLAATSAALVRLGVEAPSGHPDTTALPSCLSLMPSVKPMNTVSFRAFWAPPATAGITRPCTTCPVASAQGCLVLEGMYLLCVAACVCTLPSPQAAATAVVELFDFFGLIYSLV